MQGPNGRREQRARRRRRSARRWALASVALIAVAALAVGLGFAGSSSDIAEGVRIAGIDVGGMSASEAERKLEQRTRVLENVPVVFHVGPQRFRIAPSTLGVEVDWRSAVAAARRQGEGFGPFRGFRRLGMRFFGANVTPSTRVYDAALQYELAVLGRSVDRKPREAKIVLHGLRPVVVPGRVGRVLDRGTSADAMVEALASFSRAPVWLPLKVERPHVTAAMLRPVAKRVRIALSAPVQLRIGRGRYRLAAWRIARLLDLPDQGARTLAIRGPYARHYFDQLGKAIEREPADAQFAVDGGHVSIVPSRTGHRINPLLTARAILAAATRPAPRVAQISVVTTAPERTTAKAKAMGVVGLVSSYETIFGGVPNRIHNVQLVSHLVDNHLIAPGEEFSFNKTTGERNAAKGFLEAPVIVNGELQTGLGGGVCQVSTTVFNAAYEAGLKITARTNHALYISHYPQGRDATVDYPSIDLRFVNDTGHWLLLRTFVGSSSLVVNLYGTPTGRKVESVTGPLYTTGPTPVERVPDPTLEKGQTEIVTYGSPPRATSVHRKVYTADGKLLHDDTFYSSYRGETEVIRVGTKPLPKPKPKPKPKPRAPSTPAPSMPGLYPPI